MTNTQVTKGKTIFEIKRAEGKINDIAIFETIGQGSFSEVKLGTMPSGQDVAVKILKDQISGNDLQLVANETKAMNSIPNHPNVLNILSSGGDA